MHVLSERELSRSSGRVARAGTTPSGETSVADATLFYPRADETPVLGFVHYRVVPALRHIGWLTLDGG